VYQRTEPLVRVDQDALDSLPGFELQTPAGLVRTLPSANRIEWLPNGGDGAVLLGERAGLRRPSGIAATDSHLWIADTANRRILRWDIEGNSIDDSSMDILQTPELRRPVGLAASAGLLFVADAWSDKILVLDETGRMQRSIGQHGSQPGFLSGPLGLLLHNNTLFVADSRNSRVQAFDPESGEFAYEWGLHVIRPHEGEGRLHYPARLIVSEDGTSIGVSEPWEDRVQWFRRASPDEQVPQRLPLGADDFIHYGPGVDNYDRLIAITDPDTHSVRIFDLQLDTPVLIGVVGGFGELPAQFIHPGDVAFLPPHDDRPLRLAVADRGNARIALYSIDWSPDETLRFRPTLASLLRTFSLLAVEPAPTHPIDPVAISAVPDDRLLLIDGTNSRAMVLDHRLRISSTSELTGQLAAPPNWTICSGIASAPSMLLDRRNRRLVPLANASGQPEIRLSASIERPVAALIRSEDMLIVDQALNAIVRCDLEGNPIEYIGQSGLGAGHFFKPASIIELTSGRILVVDRGNHRLKFFDPDWNLAKISGPRLYIQPAQLGERAPRSSRPPEKAGPNSE
jgi:hypothetical protein